MSLNVGGSPAYRCPTCGQTVIESERIAHETRCRYVSPHTSFALARLAGCADPGDHDSEDGGSPGAVWLRQIETSTREEWESRTANESLTDPDFAEVSPETVAEQMVDSTALAELLAGLIPTDPAQVFAIFTDLGGWRETVGRFADDWPSDRNVNLTALARVALRQIAERLVLALVSEWASKGGDEQ